MVDVVKEHMLSILKKGKRSDARGFEDFREIKIEYNISKSAEGSAKVSIGDTEVIAGVKLELTEPFPDTPDEGGIMINVELRPMSSPDFELGPPSHEAIELSRVVDRAIREGHALDFKKLCLKKGESCWMVIIDIYPVNDAGNLFDAAGLAAMAALQETKFPKIEENNVVNYKESSGKKLPLKAMPLCCTVVKIGDYFIVDPDNEEEKEVDAKLVVGILEDGNLCSMQKTGEMGLDANELEKMVDLAIKKTKELRKVLSK
ncbi:exosome complex protein Rrp42 [Candidatus Woesearchaeota archaeon]|nr:exosome complex protein Rrp42 [Candidatus Woesearchaeota archaeon]